MEINVTRPGYRPPAGAGLLAGLLLAAVVAAVLMLVGLPVVLWP